MHTILIATKHPTDSALMLACEHIMKKRKTEKDLKCLKVVVKSIIDTTEKKTYNFVQ